MTKPMNDGDDLVYNFAGMDTIQMSISTFVSDMQANLDEVYTTFNNLIANGWQGMTAGALNDYQTQWNQQATNIATVLQKVADAVGNAAANMQAADAAAATHF